MKKIFLLLFLSIALILPAADKKQPGGTQKIEFTRNVRHGARGRVYIDHIPALAQKQNYCAPATFSMILGYYDTKVAQKKLGKLFSSSKKMGTDLGEMESAFKNSELAKSFNMKSIYSAGKRFERILDVYRKEASKKDLKRLEKLSHPGEDVLDLLNLKVLQKCSFSPDPENMKTFSRILKVFVDAGHPLFWVVWMGLEPQSPSNDTHARVLCGYQIDDQGKLTHFLFLDPWSKKREIKEMEAERALLMTTTVYSILPVSVPDPLKSPSAALPKERP